MNSFRVSILTIELLGVRTYSVNCHLLLLLKWISDTIKGLKFRIITSETTSYCHSFNQIQMLYGIDLKDVEIEVDTVDYKDSSTVSSMLCGDAIVISEIYVWADAIHLLKKQSPKTKVIYSLHSILQQEYIINKQMGWNGYDLFLNMQEKMIHDADILIFDSQYDMHICNTFYSTQNKSKTIYPVTSIEKCLSSWRPISQDTFMYAGRWEPRKGIEQLIRSFFKYNTIHRSSQLIIFSDISFVQNSEALFSSKTVLHMFRCLLEDHRIVLQNWKNSRIEYLNYLVNHTNCLILPSLYDPFNIIAYESVLMGVPLIISGCCGVIEVLSHNANYNIVNPYNSEDIYQKMLSLAVWSANECEQQDEAKGAIYTTQNAKDDWNNLINKLL